MSDVANAAGGLINSAAVGVAYSPPVEETPEPVAKATKTAAKTEPPAPEPAPPPVEASESK